MTLYIKASNMNQYKVDFSSIPWETPAPGVRFKAVQENDNQVRIVEFTKEFVEPDWCKKDHVGYILEGQLEINYNGKKIVYNPGNALSIPEGEDHKHMAKTITDVVKIFLVENI